MLHDDNEQSSATAQSQPSPAEVFWTAAQAESLSPPTSDPENLTQPTPDEKPWWQSFLPYVVFVLVGLAVRIFFWD